MAKQSSPSNQDCLPITGILKAREALPKDVDCNRHQSYKKGLDHDMLRGYETGEFPPVSLGFDFLQAQCRNSHVKTDISFGTLFQPASLMHVLCPDVVELGGRRVDISTLPHEHK